MRIVLTLLFFSLSIVLLGQETGTVFGKIVDENENPLIGATVIYQGKNTIGATADFEGNYTIELPAGERKLICRFTNMKTDTFTVNVEAKQYFEHNIQLIKYDAIKNFDEVQIRRNKMAKKPEDIIVSMSIIKPKAIENNNTRNITSILNQTPGLNIMDGEPKIRGGSGFTFGVGSKVAVYVDGMPLLSGDAGQALWGLIPVENIKQIEVIKGAGSVLTGSSALSGAIRIQTQYPSVKPLTKINVYTGLYTYPERKDQVWQDRPSLISGASVLHSQKIGYWDITIGANLNYDEGYIGPPIQDPYIEQSFPDTISNFTNEQMRSKRARLNFQIRRRSKKVHGLSYGLNGNGMLRHSPMVFAWLDDTSGLYQGYPQATFLREQTIFYLDPFVNLHLESGSEHSLKGRFMYVNNDITANQDNQSKVYYIDYQFNKIYPKFLGIEFIGGITSTYTDSYAEMYASSGSPTNKLLNLSGYAQLQKSIWEIVNLTVGGRLEYFKLNDQEATIKPIFRIGGNIKVREGTFVRMSYGQGYRFPTITERFIHTGVGNFGVFPNPDLNPETSSNSEVGVRQGFKFGNVMGFLDIAGFWQEYRNTIEYLFGFWDLSSPVAAGFKFLNTGESRIIGFDGSFVGTAEITPKNDLNFIVGYTYILPRTLNPDLIYAEDEHPGEHKQYTYNNTSLEPDDRILKYRFLHHIKADLSWTYNDKISIGGSIQYYSKMVNMDGVIKEFEEATQNISTIQDIRYMDYYYANNHGTFVINARANYSFNEKNKLSIVCKNLLNNSYSLRPLKIEPPRSIVLQYTLEI